MDSRLLAYAQRQAPRYTSYPSAPHFSPSIGAKEMTRWLGELSAQARLSLYIHVPYCRQLCWYCGCNTYAARRDEPVRDFVETLLDELDLVAAVTPARQLTEIHWGGGTPNILSPAEFDRIAERIAARFDIDSKARHAVELDPRYVDAEKARAYARARVNRVSLGVQDLNSRVQQAIGRVQPVDTVCQAVGILREAGIAQVNMDLMYGLPHQSTDDLRHSIEVAAAMHPDRVALFGYAHVPWFKKRQRLISETALPGPEQRFEQAEAARDQLQALGYVAIGLDHFALPSDELAGALRDGRLRRSFQGYVLESADAIIGVGPSAISTLPNGYAQNAPEPGAWANAIAERRPATVRGHELSDDDLMRGRLIEQIMCDFDADLTLLVGAAAWADELASLAPMFADGMLTLQDDRLLLSAEVRPFCRLVAMAFDAYAPRSVARHSRAV
jgi:oxygen-independent coproporphyrinogen III oxidase